MQRIRISVINFLIRDRKRLGLLIFATYEALFRVLCVTIGAPKIFVRKESFFEMLGTPTHVSMRSYAHISLRTVGAIGMVLVFCNDE